MSEATHYLPYPELVEPIANEKPYEIIDTIGRDDLPTNGGVNFDNRIFFSPLNAEGEGVIRHELGHVRWSPPIPDGLDEELYGLLYACEDARINGGLKAVGLPVEFKDSCRERLKSVTIEDDSATFALRAIATLGTDMEERIFEFGKGQDLELAHELQDLARTWMEKRRAEGMPLAPYSATLGLVEKLRELFILRGMPIPRPEAFYMPLGMGAGGSALGDGWSGGGGPRLFQIAYNKSGRAELSAPPLKVPIVAKRIGERPERGRSTEEGVRMRSPHRWPLDRAIFRRKKRDAGGSVLIDVSGSMSISLPALDEALKKANYHVIAIYSGAADKGKIVIVARGKWRVEAKHFERWNGNVIDLPALEWLERQPPPRSWVSDGGVTGLHDGACVEIQKACATVTKRARITRYNNLDDFFEKVHA